MASDHESLFTSAETPRERAERKQREIADERARHQRQSDEREEKRRKEQEEDTR